MKNIRILSFLLFFVSINIYSQNEYIIDNKGNKIIIDEGSSQMSSSFGSTSAISTIIYYTVKGKHLRIDFFKVKEASYGNYKIESFNVLKNKTLPFFIFTENENYKLIGFCNSKGISNHYIIDNNENIIEELSLKPYRYDDKNLKNRERIDSKIREYFGDCEDLINRLDRYKHNTVVVTNKNKFAGDFDNEDIANNKKFENLNSFFSNPVFLTCK